MLLISLNFEMCRRIQNVMVVVNNFSDNQKTFIRSDVLFFNFFIFCTIFSKCQASCRYWLINLLDFILLVLKHVRSIINLMNILHLNGIMVEAYGRYIRSINLRIKRYNLDKGSILSSHPIFFWFAHTLSGDRVEDVYKGRL